MANFKYLGIKVRGQNFWIWFDNKNVDENQSQFKGEQGHTVKGIINIIEIPTKLIEGRMHSDTLIIT